MPSFYRNPSGITYALRDAERPGCLIFAEGHAEAWFLERWLEVTGSNPSDIAVICFEGQKKLDPNFRILAQEGNFGAVTRLGFLLDAENRSAAAVVDSIRQILQKNNIISPRATLSAGVLLEEDRFRIIVHVSPDNHSTGYVENIVLDEIHAHRYAGCIQAFEGAIRSVGETPFPKTLVSAFLGIHEAGLCGTHLGFSRRYLDVMHVAYSGIRATLGQIL